VSGAISFLDALRGLQQGFYSWSTVKLYYTVFYLLRALLATNSVAIIYEGRKPRRLHAKAGATCTAAKGTTHQAVLSLFSAELSSHWLLSQDIAFQTPPNWLMQLREEANYSRAHFWEPDCPAHFNFHGRVGVRRMIVAYLADSALAFDPDHAAIAFPLQALLRARSQIACVAAEDAAFIRMRAVDQSGPLAELIRALLL
jgi:hypothetical protein